jgi:hypothetical protein
MIKALLLILIIFYSVRFFSRLLLPILFKTMVKRAANSNMRPNEPKKREGEVSIDKTSKQKKQSNSSVGEYVDFEELDDNS